MRRILPALLLLGCAIGALCAPARLDAFYRQHCLLIKNGYLKGESASPEEILQDYDKLGGGKPLVIHFHGGLVSESSAKKEAADLYDTCYGSESFPIYFVWNADFFSELGVLLEKKYHDLAYVQGHLSTAAFLEKVYENARQSGVSFAQLQACASNLVESYRKYMRNDPAFQAAVKKQASKESKEDVLSAGKSWSDWTQAETWIKVKDRIQKKVTTYFEPYVAAVARYHDSRSVSYGGDFLEWISSNLGGRDIWSRMKRDTALSFETRNGVPGAGLQFLHALAHHPVRRVVLIGHSTGCIYITNFLRAAKRLMPFTKFDVIFLAPANTYAETASFLSTYANTIRNFRMFGIRDANERHDHMLWQINPSLEGLYPGSLLIYVSRAVESRRNMPILGLERDFPTPIREPDRSNNLIVKRFLFSRPDSIVWSPTNGRVGVCSNCVSHGDFCSDPKTLASLRFLIKDPGW